MTPQDASARARDICLMAPVIPVLVIHDLAHARPLAEALVAGGLPVLEVTLRTPVALAAIAEMAKVPGAVVGAGTLLRPQDVRDALAAGATFGVSPGATDRMLQACEDEGLALLPGAATASEVMALFERGYTTQKFFPAENIGGAGAVKSIGAPIPQVSFCPTGGITPQKAADYLALANVLCVGGSWVAPTDALAAGDWGRITALAQDASRLPRAAK